MVADEYQFELRLKLEGGFVHMASSNRISASQRGNSRFIPAAALLGLGRGDKAGAGQAGDFLGVFGAVARREAVDLGCAPVVAQDIGERREELRFPARPRPMDE